MKIFVLIFTFCLAGTFFVNAQSTLSVPSCSVTITANGPTTFCQGDSVILTSTMNGETSPYAYLWSNGATAQSITVNSSENYSVTVTDTTGCIASSAIIAVNVLTVKITIDTIFCGAKDSFGNQQYSFSLLVNDTTNTTGYVAAITLSDGTITEIATMTVTPGADTIKGKFITNSFSNNILHFSVNITFPNSTDTCSSQLCFLLPNCSVNVCDGNLLQNGTFKNSNVPGPMPSGGSVTNWFAAYGNPVVSDSAGCDDSGYVKLQGHKISGNAIKQTLSSGNKIIQGRKYILSTCVRVDAAASALSYIKVRAIAFNGNLPAGNNHPAPDSNIAIIGFTGIIKSMDWTTIEFHQWIANKNFDNIAINIYNNDSALFSVGDIDGICFRESFDTVSCDSIGIDSFGNPIIPADLAACLGAGNNPPIFDIDTVDVFMGNVKDLYGWCGNTDLDTWYENQACIPCATIGGTVPPEALNINFNDSLAALGIDTSDITVDSIQKALQFIADSIYNEVLKAPPSAFLTCGALDTACSCDTATTFIPDNNSPFQGRDIVFVLGFDLVPLTEKITNLTSKAHKKWPFRKEEFYKDYQGNGYSGYWKERADEYWKKHIDRFLKSNPAYKNRYLVIAWATTQTLDFAVHAMLSQISEAMINEEGVILLDPSDKRKKEGFGRNGYVLISHSTGALLTDVAMAVANKTKTDTMYRNKLGPIGYIPDRAKLHISLHGAMSGSSFATGAIALATNFPYIMPLIRMFWNLADLDIDNITAAADIIHTSVFRDLVPKVSQEYWMDSIGKNTPVPVLTVAGGHPNYNTLLVKHIFHSGFDDGVVTMDCQCGNNNLDADGPSNYQPTSSLFNANVFDMGIGGARAIFYYVDQVIEGDISAACVPGLSVTGMRQPFDKNGSPNPLNRYSNHYSFLQSASEHSIDPHVNYPDYQQTGSGSNSEEVRAITNDYVYYLGFISNDVRNLMQTQLKGSKFSWTIEFPWPFNAITIEWWWWQRTYDRLKGFESMNEGDYVYKYVLKP